MEDASRSSTVMSMDELDVIRELGKGVTASCT